MFPKYICLNWLSIKNWTVEFSNIQPLYSYVNQIKLRKIDKELHVYGKIKDNYCNLGDIDNSKHIHNISLLKSNLQKTIRQSKVDEALMTSLNLIQKDIMSFIRRLLIISLEDVGVVPDTVSLITFLLVSYPNIEITNEIVKILLLTVYRLTIYPKKHYPDVHASPFELEYDKYDYSDNIINSLIIASEYGGFKGDTMLYYKFINSKKRIILPVKTGKLILKRTICRSDILSSSIDFHCYPHILENISKNTDLKMDTVKNLIWVNSSSKNSRTSHKIIDKKVWEIINKELNKIVNSIIKKIHIF